MSLAPSKIFLWILLLVSATAVGCNRKRVNRDGFAGSGQEIAALTESPFSAESAPFVPEQHMTGVAGDPTVYGIPNSEDDDSRTPRNDFLLTGGTDEDGRSQFVTHCDPANYERELKAAMTEAANDPDKKTIVVRYSFSFGTPFDDTAYLAYKRSILRLDDDGYTPVPVAPEGSLDWDDYYGSRARHYFGDHRQARRDYIDGKKCYFSTMKVAADEAGPIMKDPHRKDHTLPGDRCSDDVYDHTLNILYYGDAYSCLGDNCLRRDLSPRLFKPVDQVANDIKASLASFQIDNLTELKLSQWIKKCPTPTRPQIIPLYVADIREQRIHLPATDGKLIDRRFSSSAVRRWEYEVKLKKILDLRTLWWNLSDITDSFQAPWDMCNYAFAAYEGAAQLLDNLVFSGLNGTVLSTQYTPIVVDLPTGDTPEEYADNKHITTSSLDWGTFFNMANLRWWNESKGRLEDIHHHTAWVGGKLRKEPATGKYRRVATDGFLVTPEVAKDGDGHALSCGDGSPKWDVPRGEDLFGSYAKVEGGLRTYNNGFQKLREWVSAHSAYPKDCQAVGNASAALMKKRYFGPWDGEAYGKIKVWVDRNRNGIVDCGEILSLKEAKIAALNTCNINYSTNDHGELKPLADRYGNTTSFRAAFLVGDNLSEDEVLSRLGTGHAADGSSAEFRVAIDLLFRVNTGLYLEDVEPDDIIDPYTPAHSGGSP